MLSPEFRISQKGNLVAHHVETDLIELGILR
jgi:hypothetical protein